MHYYEVAPTRIVRASSAVFTYASVDPIAIGQLVVVSVGNKSMTGVVLKAVPEPSFEAKLIDTLLPYSPLPSHLLDVALWMSEYYSSHLATVFQTILPRGVEKTRRPRTMTASAAIRKKTSYTLNKSQRHALHTIASSSPGTVILHGITGSGKTAVYIEAAKQALARGESSIILVPEIALTSQLVDEFSGHFNNVILAHSKQTEAERHTIWTEALRSQEPRVAIGPRSALFMPLRSVGLVVIDEEHEPSFKQEQSPRYSAQRTASILVSTTGGRLILGSATPLVTDYYFAEKAKRPIIAMDAPAREDAVPARVQLIDMTKKPNFKKHRFISDELLAKLSETFASGKQALIFHNRRGSASITLCDNCGWSALCPRCFVPLTLHSDQHILRCHICDFKDKVPSSCPSCHETEILHRGIGTKLIESELARLFPTVTIGRFDGDTDDASTVDKRYAELYGGSIQLIIGTQVIAKGLDLPHLRTVGVIQADASLALPDYGSRERTFQLLAQVVGRVGRSSHETTVIVQSYQPDHPSVRYGLSQDYRAFYTSELYERKRGLFPPFTYLLKLTCTYKTESSAVRAARTLQVTLSEHASPDVRILGPTPALYEYQHGTYRWQLILKSPKRQALVDLLAYVPTSYWQSELDPANLL